MLGSSSSVRVLRINPKANILTTISITKKVRNIGSITAAALLDQCSGPLSGLSNARKMQLAPMRKRIKFSNQLLDAMFQRVQNCARSSAFRGS